MVSVSIFALWDVIHQVQTQYHTPYNGTFHTTPSTKADIKNIYKYLREQELQSYHSNHKNNQYGTPAHDLMAVGTEYANKAGAFKNFKCDIRKAQNKGVPEGTLTSAGDESDNVDAAQEMDHDLGGNVDLDIDDLALDDNEFPFGMDIGDFILMTREVIDELSCYD